jgi:hypothetical protein
MPMIYRGMKDDGEGMPACGPTARTLGVRLTRDIKISEDQMVGPGTGGMSVAPDSPQNLERHRRPAEHGGYGPDPVWEIDSDDLPSTLAYRPDPRNVSRHGFVEPIEEMSLNAYQEALATSRGFWSRK